MTRVAACDDCGKPTNEHPSRRCQNFDHLDAYERACAAEHASRFSTRIRDANDFEVLRDILAEHFEGRGE